MISLDTHMQLKMAKQQVEQFKTISDGVEGQLKESNEVKLWILSIRLAAKFMQFFVGNCKLITAET